MRHPVRVGSTTKIFRCMRVPIDLARGHSIAEMRQRDDVEASASGSGQECPSGVSLHMPALETFAP